MNHPSEHFKTVHVDAFYLGFDLCLDQRLGLSFGVHNLEGLQQIKAQSHGEHE